MLENYNVKNEVEPSIETKGIKKTTAGALVAAYIEAEKERVKDNINKFIELVINMYNDNSYLSEERTSVNGKSVLPLVYVKVENVTNNSKIEGLDKNFKTIELNKDSSSGDDVKIIYTLRDIMKENKKLLADSLIEQDLNFLYELTYDMMFIYPECLQKEALEYIDKKTESDKK